MNLPGGGGVVGPGGSGIPSSHDPTVKEKSSMAMSPCQPSTDSFENDLKSFKEIHFVIFP